MLFLLFVQHQMRLDAYFSFDTPFAKFRSSRMQKALMGISGGVAQDLMTKSTDASEVQTSEPMASKKVDAKKKDTGKRKRTTESLRSRKSQKAAKKLASESESDES
jgi:hypothetical protein